CWRRRGGWGRRWSWRWSWRRRWCRGGRRCWRRCWRRHIATGQLVFWNSDNVGVEPAGPAIGRPNHVLAGHIEVPFGELPVIVGATAGRVEVRDVRRHDELLERPVQAEAQKFVRAWQILPTRLRAAGV